MKDRELVIIGAGAFLTVLCLLFNWPFAIRVVVGVAVLIFFTSFALWPVGPERLTIEEALMRYVRKARRPKKFALIDERQDQVAPPRGEVINAPPEENVAAQASSDSTPAEKPAAARMTESSDLNYEAGQPFVGEVDFSRVMMIWLGVIGVYFIYWLFQGGSREIGEWMKTLFP